MRFTLPLVAVLLILAGCAPAPVPAKAEPYADLKAIYLKVIDAQDQLSTGVSLAKDGKKVAQVIVTYTAKMREITPELNAAQNKYPEFRNATTPPAELQPTIDALTASNGKMMEQMVKIQDYLDEPEVTKAMNELSAAAQASAP